MIHHSGAHRAEDEDGPDVGPTVKPPRTDGRGRSLRSQLLIGAMCVLLGFAIVAQVRQTQDDEFSALREDDLVRLLDEVTQRNEELSEQSQQLTRQRDSLLSGSDGRAAEDLLDLLDILAGTVAVEGPGVIVTVEDPGGGVDAQHMVHMLEEMRNAGAEAIAVSGQRLTASSAFEDTPEGGIAVNGSLIESPYQWRVIGNAETIGVALDIPGGAFAIMRNAEATVGISERELVQITAVRDVPDPEFAEPVENDS